MSKKCTKCNTIKDNSDFAISKSNKDGLQYQCRTCRAEYKRERREYISKVEKERYYSKKHDYVVYLMPDDNYVGVTTNLAKRMATHKCHYGRNTDGVRVLCEFKDKESARELEDFIHSLGYAGKYGTNKKSKYK